MIVSIRMIVNICNDLSRGAAAIRLRPLLYEIQGGRFAYEKIGISQLCARTHVCFTHFWRPSVNLQKWI